MSGPWERYAKRDGPWAKYAKAPPAEAPAEESGDFIDNAMKVGDAVWDYATAPLNPSKWTGAAEGIANDISAGLQRVNPVSVSKHRGQAVGVLKDGYVDVDGTREPLENYPADRYVTRQDGGQTYIYPRTPDMAESRAASAGRLLGYGVPNALPSAATAVGRAPSAANEAADLGITPSFAMRGTVPGKIAAAGEQFAPTASRFRQDASRVTGEMQDAAFMLADRAGPGATPYDAGSAIQRGGESYVSAVKDRRAVLYGVVDKAMPRGSQIAAPETVALLEREVGALAETPNIAASLGTTKLAGWLDDLRGGLTWETARKLRTEVGEAVGQISGPTADMAQGRLKAIYGALSKDLDAAASAAGPEAARAWNAANTYTRVSQKRIDTAFGKVLGKNVTPEQAYDRLVGMTMEGGSRANIDALSGMFKSLPKEDAAEVAGTLIRRLGRANAGAQDAEGAAWSADTFLTNWNKMSPQARGLIGRSGLDPHVGQELSKLARVTERAKEAGTFRNRSNTGNAITAGGLGAWLFSEPISAVTAIAASHLSARAMTNVGFLRALNEAATGRTGGLQRIAASKSPLAIEAQTILRLQAPEASSPQSLPIERVPAPY